MNRDEITEGTTYIGAKEDVRRVIGIGTSYAPHQHTTDKIWVAYEEISEVRKNKGRPQGRSKDGFPIYHCSLTAFRLWAEELGDLVMIDVPASTPVQ